LSGILAAAALAESQNPCGVENQDLRDGNVVVRQRPPNGDGIALVACGVVEAPPRAVWPVLRDCDLYEQFLPGVERSILLGRRDGVARCDVSIDLPFPLDDLRSVTRVEEIERRDGGFARKWSLVGGNYRRNEGSWTLSAWGAEGRQTLAVYELDIELDTIVPDFLLWRVQSATAPKVFDAIRQRVALCESRACDGGGS
jgi:ribosome-associated toxin RatA of RatAB toxin-antitoxin module